MIAKIKISAEKLQYKFKLVEERIGKLADRWKLHSRNKMIKKKRKKKIEPQRNVGHP